MAENRNTCDSQLYNLGRSLCCWDPSQTSVASNTENSKEYKGNAELLGVLLGREGIA